MDTWDAHLSPSRVVAGAVGHSRVGFFVLLGLDCEDNVHYYYSKSYFALPFYKYAHRFFSLIKGEEKS